MKNPTSHEPKNISIAFTDSIKHVLGITIDLDEKCWDLANRIFEVSKQLQVPESVILTKVGEILTTGQTK
jgi:hypothetical protein